MLGQTSLLIGAAILWSLIVLPNRPILGGVLLGVAATLKPQLALLAPVALLAGKHWVAFAAAALGSIASVLLSLPFGVSLWPSWLASLKEFEGILASYNLFRMGATPVMAARAMEWEPLWPVQLLGGSMGALAVWVAFRGSDLSTRIVAFIGGCLLAAPYAMVYDLAPLTPLAATALFSRTRRMVGAAPLFAMNVFTAVPALVLAILAFLARRKRGSNVTTPTRVGGNAAG
jgi:hypothetical protein